MDGTLADFAEKNNPHAKDTLKKIQDIAGELPVSAVIWTTTPWTLPANLALSVHPEFEYIVVKGRDGAGDSGASAHPGEILILAKELAPGALEKFGLKEYETLLTVNGLGP